MGQGLLAEAQPQLEHALRLDPSDTEVKRDLARIYDLQGEPARAVALLRSLVASSPADSETRGLLAAASLRSGDFAEATRELDALLTMNPRSPGEIYVLAVRAWQKSGDFTKALEVGEQGMRLYPYSRRIEGVYLETPPELLATRIETRMERLAATQPDSPGEMIALGRIIIDWPPAAEQLAGAAETMASRAVGLNPRSAFALYHHARCLGCLRRYTEAVAALERALTPEPDGELTTLIHTRLGEFEDKQSHPEGARQAFRAAMEVNRNLKEHVPDAACDYVKFLNREAMTQEARSIAEEVLRWSPFHMPARLELATILGRESRWPEAIEEARLVIRNAEDETMLRSAHYFLARAYHVTGREDLAKAEQSWLEAHKAKPAGGRTP